MGAGKYIIQLVRSLASLDTDHNFVIFAHQSGRNLFEIPDNPAIHWKIIPDKPPALRLIWEQTVFPVLIRRTGVSILHSMHYTQPLLLPCKSVVTFHDLTFFLFPEHHTRPKRIFFPVAMQLSARNSNAIITGSESTRNDAIRLLGVPPAKIHTVPYGIGKEFRPIKGASLLEECRRKYNLPPEFILSVGLIEPRKNLPLLLHAYKKLANEIKIPPLVIVGRHGWGSKQVQHLIETLDIKSKVLFTGYVSAQDLPMVYNLAKLFVYPSIYEGFGFPPLEAMACGTAVISTSVSAMLDNLNDAGYLVPPNDETALAHAIRTVLTNQDVREDLSSKGLKRAADFTWKHTAQETLKVYQSLVA